MSNLSDLPKGWVWSSLDQLSGHIPRSIQSGPFGSALKHSEFQETGRLVIGIDNVQDGWFSSGSDNRISLEKFNDLAKFRARPNDLLITVMATIGRCCLVPSGLEPAIVTKHIYRISLNQLFASPQYILTAVRTHPLTRQVMFGSTQGQTRPGLNSGIIRSLPIALPSLEEQKMANLMAESILEPLNSSDKKLAKLAAQPVSLCQAVLRCAFSGQLVPQNPNDEPASILLERIAAERTAQIKRETNSPHRRTRNAKREASE